MEYNNIKQIQDFRIFAHYHIYNSTNIIDLINNLDNYIGAKSVAFNEECGVVEIRIPHNSTLTQIVSYYGLIDNAFNDYLNDDCIKVIMDRTTTQMKNRNVYETYIDIRTGKIPVSSIYDASLFIANENEDVIIIKL